MNYLYYLVNCLLFSLGAFSFIASGLGTDPLDVFCLGIQKHIDIKIGTIQVLFALLCLITYSALSGFKFPPLSTFATFAICGYTIDFLRFWLGDLDANPYLLLINGLILCLQGSAGIIVSGIGVRAMDLVALRLEELKLGPFWVYKGIAEALLLGIGWYLGGPVGIGTIAFLVVVGWLIKPAVEINRLAFSQNYEKN
jgi:uncharacterized membrane protein YczE